MKFVPNKTRRYQIGGEMAAPEEPVAEPMPEEAPEQGQGDPLMEVAQIAAQALQTQDCNAAMQVCQIFLQMVQQMQGQPAPQQQGEPVFKKGGILVRRNKK